MEEVGDDFFVILAGGGDSRFLDQISMVTCEIRLGRKYWNQTVEHPVSWYSGRPVYILVSRRVFFFNVCERRKKMSFLSHMRLLSVLYTYIHVYIHCICKIAIQLCLGESILLLRD